LNDGAELVATDLLRRRHGAVTGKAGRMAGPQFEDPLLTVSEVAQLMRVSNMTVYRLIKAGQLAAIRVGKNYRIRHRDVERYLVERAVRIEEES
jgi:excisionase family DNA binding protein